MTFAEKVYEAVTKIPAGRVATYGQIADIIGCPGGARAVGNALHVNPFAPRDEFSSEEPLTGHAVVPCHRVVAADGGLAAHFGCGGPSVQYARLQAEGVTFSGFCVDLVKCGIVIERHPLQPFLPAGGRMLFLGSFPPPRARWSMEFFYPNWINDFWRIQGLIHFGDARHFEAPGKCFDLEKVVSFCLAEGLGFYDTASKVCRWKGNASDEFLEILEPAPVASLLTEMPLCRTIVTTGGKSSEEFAAIAASLGECRQEVSVPKAGDFTDITLAGRAVRWWRMPSSSRAFPMSLPDKASHYAKLFSKKNIFAG